MGGLTARSFVKKYLDHMPVNQEKLGFVMTVNNPMGGTAAAASEVRHSPIVVPSWLGIEPNSEFLKDLHTWQWPDKTPYHLVISCKAGKGDDGVIPLQIQALVSLQTEADRVLILNNNI